MIVFFKQPSLRNTMQETSMSYESMHEIYLKYARPFQIVITWFQVVLKSFG